MSVKFSHPPTLGVSIFTSAVGWPVQVGGSRVVGPCGDPASLARDNIYVLIIIIYFRYLYCDETMFTEDVVLPTLYAAKKYIIPALVDKCIQYLEHNLNPDNVCLIYEQVNVGSQICQTFKDPFMCWQLHQQSYKRLRERRFMSLREGVYSKESDCILDDIYRIKNKFLLTTKHFK